MKFYTSVDRRGDTIFVREVNGKERLNYCIKDFVPTLLVPDSKGQFKNEFGHPLAKVDLDSISDASKFIREYSDVDGFDVYGSSNFVSQFITENYPGEIEFDSSLIRVFNFDIECASDEGFPYPENAEYEVISISLYDSQTKIIYVWGLYEYNNSREDVIYHHSSTEESLLRSFIEFWRTNCPDVMTGWNISTFDIPYLVNRIKKVLGESAVKSFSPWGIISETTIRGDFGRENQSYNFMGIACLDYLDLYKKYTYSGQESYALDHIAHVELKEKKVDYSEAGTLHNLYLTNFQKFLEYNIQDVELVKKLDEKMRLIELVYTLAYMTKQTFPDTFSPVRTWESMIYNWNYEKGIFSKVKNTRGNANVQVAGAFVKVPEPRAYEWIVSLDLDGLYPHLIMQYNLGYDTIDEDLSPTVEDYVEKYLSHCDKSEKELQNERRILPFINKTEDTSKYKELERAVAANGTYYRKDHQSMFSCLMENLYSNRKKTKRLMLQKEQERENTKDKKEKEELTNLIASLNNKQMALKILANSGYGAIANRYFQFFDPRIAEAITLSGQLSIRWVRSRLDAYLNNLLNTDGIEYVKYVDTDSAYLELKALVDEIFGKDVKKEDYTEVVNFLDKAVKNRIEPFIEKCYEELADYMNAYRNAMRMTREVIASRGFWTAKKRYALMVYDSEGVRYAEPKPKILGLEVKKSSTPEFCREKLEEAIKIILEGTNDELLEFLEEVRKEFNSLGPEDIAFPRSVSGLRKYAESGRAIFKKGSPKHVKGALIYNHMLKEKEMKLEQPIQEGGKIKFVDLKEPNPIHQNVIAFPSNSVLPKEFGLHDYINYDLQFEKAFFQPLKTMLDAVGWKSDRNSTLEIFFG